MVDVAVSKLPTTWAIRQRADVYIETGRHENVVVLPQRLIVWRGGEPGVLLDDAGAARWTGVVLGLRGSDVVEVTDGVAAGQIVISVTEGAKPPREGRSLRYTRP